MLVLGMYHPSRALDRLSVGLMFIPFGGFLTAQKLLHRAGHLVGGLGLHIPYIKAHILDSRSSFL